MRLADQSHRRRALLDGFQGIFNLEDAALGRAIRAFLSVSCEVLDGYRGGGRYKVTESLS
jgi:hypothetical protein